MVGIPNELCVSGLLILHVLFLVGVGGEPGHPTFASTGFLGPSVTWWAC